jgi:hypothetical protein
MQPQIDTDGHRSEMEFGGNETAHFSVSQSLLPWPLFSSGLFRVNPCPSVVRISSYRIVSVECRAPRCADAFVNGEIDNMLSIDQR